MSELNAQEALLLLKKKGSKLEKKLNEAIQDELNNKEFIELFNTIGPNLAKRIEDTQEYVELLSAILNFPTKKDHHNLANLVIQLEEKVDQIEEYLYALNKTLDEMKVIKHADHAFEKENPPSYHASSNDSSVRSNDTSEEIEDLEKPLNDDSDTLNQSLNEMKHTPDALDNESEQENVSEPNENSNDESTFTSDINEENEEQGKTSNPGRSTKSLRELHRERILNHLSDLINLYKKDEE